MSVVSDRIDVVEIPVPALSSNLRDVALPGHRINNEEILYSLQCACDNSSGVCEVVEAAMLRVLKLLVGQRFKDEQVALGCPDWSLVCAPVDLSKEVVVLSVGKRPKVFIQDLGKQLSIFCLIPLSRNEIKILLAASRYESYQHVIPGAHWKHFKSIVSGLKPGNSEIEFTFFDSAKHALGVLPFQNLENADAIPDSLSANFTAKMLQTFYKYG